MADEKLLIRKIFEEITGIEGLSISYHPSWKEGETENGKIFPASQDILNLLQRTRDRDKNLETSSSGPHRDRIDFVLNHHLFVPTASTGQCRLISLLLRVAQSIYYTRTTGLKPVLLMDDVLLELDPDKRAKLTAMLQFSYIEDPSVDDKTINLDYLKYYLKNEVPKYKQQQAFIKKISFFKFFFRSSCGLLEAKRNFKAARQWVNKNKYRFKMDLQTFIQEWSKQNEN